MKEYVKKDFAQISVKGLCAATPVARTTFYSYFNNTDDVRRAVEDDILQGLETITASISEGNLPDMDFALFMDAVEEYIKAHWSSIHAFLVIQPNLRFIRRWKDAIKMNFRKRYPEKQMNSNYDAVAEIVASSMISSYSYWMEHPDSVSTKTIKPMLQKVLDALVQIL